MAGREEYAGSTMLSVETRLFGKRERAEGYETEALGNGKATGRRLQERWQRESGNNKEENGGLRPDGSEADGNHA